MKKAGIWLAAFCLLAVMASCGAPENSTATDGPAAVLPQEAQTEGKEEGALVIQMTIGEKTFPVQCNDSEAARAFARQLPLTLIMRELNGNEKYCDLDERLPTDAESPGRISPGDLMLYGADCLVLFYEGFSTSYRYTPLGRAKDVAGLADAVGGGSVEVTFQLE